MTYVVPPMGTQPMPFLTTNMATRLWNEGTERQRTMPEIVKIHDIGNLTNLGISSITVNFIDIQDIIVN